MSAPPGRWRRSLVGNLREFSLVRRLLALPAFQFLLVLPALGVVGIVVLSAGFGIEHPSFNFGVVFTWVVWWGALLLSFVVFGRAWCLVCPVGALGEWVQRLSLWRRVPWTAGLHLRWPRPLRNLWLATGLFVVFVWLDNGYGMANSARLTAGLIIVITLGALWVSVLFERRAFCRYVCPLTALIGLGSLFAMLELRRHDPERCRSRCATKDCYRGNAQHYGCPMGEFPGGGMDSNLYCILCAECVKSCGQENIALRFRPPGRDLWAMRHPRADGAAAAAVVVGCATVLPLLMLALLPGTRRALAAVLPSGGAPPHDLPRLAAVGLLFVVGLSLTVGVVWGVAALGRLAVPGVTPSTRALFARTGYALVPIALSRMLADLLDHVSRTWGALGDVTRALALDFPLNRVVPGHVTVSHVLGAGSLYALQAALVLAGLAFTVHALHRIAARVAPDGAGVAALLPTAGLALGLTLISLWTLGIGLL